MRPGRDRHHLPVDRGVQRRRDEADGLGDRLPAPHPLADFDEGARRRAGVLRERQDVALDERHALDGESGGRLLVLVGMDPVAEGAPGAHDTTGDFSLIRRRAARASGASVAARRELEQPGAGALGEPVAQLGLEARELGAVALGERRELGLVLDGAGLSGGKWIDPESGGGGGGCRSATTQGELTGLHRPPGTIQSVVIGGFRREAGRRTGQRNPARARGRARRDRRRRKPSRPPPGAPSHCRRRPPALPAIAACATIPSSAMAAVTAIAHQAERGPRPQALSSVTTATGSAAASSALAAPASLVAGGFVDQHDERDGEGALGRVEVAPGEAREELRGEPRLLRPFELEARAAQHAGRGDGALGLGDRQTTRQGERRLNRHGRRDSERVVGELPRPGERLARADDDREERARGVVARAQAGAEIGHRAGRVDQVTETGDIDAFARDRSGQAAGELAQIDGAAARRFETARERREIAIRKRLAQGRMDRLGETLAELLQLGPLGGAARRERPRQQPERLADREPRRRTRAGRDRSRRAARRLRG